jgi:hypothetical protein
MDPLVQLVKELLESSDPDIKVVVCLPDHGPTCAKSGPDLARKSLDPEANAPSENSQNVPRDDPK